MRRERERSEDRDRTRHDRSREDSDREDDRLRRSRPLDHEREEERERERRRWSREPSERERLSYPSMLLDPKIGNHGRIERGSDPSKLLPIPHIVEHAVRNREKQPRKRRGQGVSAVNEQLPSRQLPKELKRQKRARNGRVSRDTLPPSRQTEI